MSDLDDMDLDDTPRGGNGRKLAADDNAFNTESVAADQLKAFIERIERMNEELAGIQGDIKEIYAEARGNGFDVKVLRKIVAMRKRDADERAEEAAILELYMSSLGMI